MPKSSITDFEDSISSAKDIFFEKFKELLLLVKNSAAKSNEIQDELTDLHSKGVKYFNLFERSITEYGIESYKLDQNIKNSKLDDAINISKTIVKYWKLLDSIKKEYQIRIPEPSERSYSTIQLFIKTFDKDKAAEIKSSFQEANLPIYGFETKRKFIDMTRKQQVTYGIVVGTILLIALLIIGLAIECPTNSQNRIFTTILALASAAFSAAIPGLINVKYREVITASGALAVFVIVFLMKPAELSDFKSCQKNVTGTVYFGDRPIESIDLLFLKQNKSTKTDNFGNFNLPLDLSSVGETLKIQLKNQGLALDTIISFKKEELTKSLDIYFKKYCVKCVQKDSTNTIVNSKQKCSASSEYIEDYITGFSNAGKKQGRTVECERK